MLKRVQPLTRMFIKRGGCYCLLSKGYWENGGLWGLYTGLSLLPSSSWCFGRWTQGRGLLLFHEERLVTNKGKFPPLPS